MRRKDEVLQEQAMAFADAASRCSFCDEPARPGAPAVECPFLGATGCPMIDPDLVSLPFSRLSETIAFPSEKSDVDLDGFPLVDDLGGRMLGQYRMGNVIGQGAMGRVYRGEHTGLGRTSAIKVLSPGLMKRQPQTVERFSAEARALAGLIHPHVVTVHNLGSDRGYHYIEMEYVPGGVSLREQLVHDGAFESLRATTLVRQVALALGAAHRSGLVHRDVKPTNVLLMPDGTAKLADFGLVRRVDDRHHAGSPLAGTPTFMAPELFKGAAADVRTDLYAVGVMWFYLLTARLPFASDKLAHLILLHRKAPVPDIKRLAPDVPDDLPPILAKLLDKDPAKRHRSADELADELKVVLGHLRDTEGLVRESLAGLDCLIQGARDRFRVIMPVPGDRIQEVYIELVEGRKNDRLLSIYSVCAPADPRHFEFALKLNAELTIGGLSVREVNGIPMFVMSRTYARGHVTPGDIRAAVLEIARRGDWVEQQLTSTDMF